MTQQEKYKEFEADLTALFEKYADLFGPEDDKAKALVLTECGEWETQVVRCSSVELKPMVYRFIQDEPSMLFGFAMAVENIKIDEAFKSMESGRLMREMMGKIKDEEQNNFKPTTEA